MRMLKIRPKNHILIHMDRSERVSLSKYLSYLLRHEPGDLGLDMDRHGWVRISQLVEKARKEGRNLNRENIREVMEESEKNRFRVSGDGRFIRAGYGHSVDVELGLEPRQPPQWLFHGTADRNLESIREWGLLQGGRQYVHLSADKEDARQVGTRHGKPVILAVEALVMHGEGHVFYRSDTEPGIWLTGHVPREHIVI